MPLSVTKQEKRTLVVVAALIVLGLIGQLVL